MRPHLAHTRELLTYSVSGTPLSGGADESTGWQPVLATMERRLGGWRARLLSRGGRLVLLKAVLLAIPSYIQDTSGGL